MKVVGFCYKSGKLKIVLDVGEGFSDRLTPIVPILLQEAFRERFSSVSEVLKDIVKDIVEREKGDLKMKLEAERAKQMEEMKKERIEELKTELERLKKEVEKGGK